MGHAYQVGNWIPSPSEPAIARPSQKGPDSEALRGSVNACSLYFWYSLVLLRPNMSAPRLVSIGRRIKMHKTDIIDRSDVGMVDLPIGHPYCARQVSAS